MPSSPDPLLLLELQAAGENLNTWGAPKLNQVITLAAQAIAGLTSFVVSGPVTLTSTNYVANQSRNAILNITGTGGAVTIPARSKIYLVRNAASGDVTFTAGGVTTATVLAGDIQWVMTDGTSVWLQEPTLAHRNDARAAKLTNLATPTNDADAATMLWVTQQILNAYTGTFPSQAGNAARFIETDGVNIYWGDPLPAQTGHANKWLTTDGTDRTGASWGAPLAVQSAGTAGKALKSPGTADSVGVWTYAGIAGIRPISAIDTVIGSDHEKLLNCTGTFALTFTLSATLGSIFATYVKNAGTGKITVTASGADTIDGLAAYIMYPGEARLFFGDGVTAFSSIILQDYDRVVTTTDPAHQWAPGYASHDGTGWGAGGGGGGGSFALVGTGAGGGVGLPFSIPASAITAGATAALTIGAGGTGGVGADGGFGGNSSIGALATFYGGGPGLNATTTSSGGGGALSTASAGSSVGGRPTVGSGASNPGMGGGNGVNAAAAGDGGFGGGGGGASFSGATLNGGASVLGGGGGGTGANPGAGNAAGTGGSSVFGGAGGTGGTGAVAGSPGTAPGGGGGGGAGNAVIGNGGVGARGEIRIRGVR